LKKQKGPQKPATLRRTRVGAPITAAQRSNRSAKAALGRKVLGLLAQELLGVCASTFTSFQANPGNGTMAMLQAYPSGAPYARQMLDDADKVAMIHTRWLRKADYVDEDGHPKVIAVLGDSPSFEALCSECGVHERLDRLLETAYRFGLSTRVGANRIAYLTEVLLLTGHRTLMLARAVVTIERLLRTSLHNAKKSRKLHEPLADRTSEVILSEEEFTRFAEMTRRLLSSFIESSDRHLLAGVARDNHTRSPKRLRRGGVTAFVFRD